MELGIPLLALGGLYIVSNQSKKNQNNHSLLDSTKETFKNKQNGWGVKNNSDLPNTDLSDKNYAVDALTTPAENNITSKLSTVNKYDGQSAYTDKYFNPEKNAAVVSSYAPLGSDKGVASQSTFVSLSGETVTKDYFRHNNMVPFFGSNIRSRNAEANSQESVLDNYIGTGSQTIIKKEQAPMFAPGENYQWANGMPNTTDFMRSRVNPSLRMANVKPFEEELVAPGIGLGYTSQGGGGFNSGMLARDLWTDKNVDQLRVLTNPKASGNNVYGYEGPAIHAITKRGDQGRQEKNRVDTYFEMNPNRYLTTTGASKGHTVRSQPIDRFVSRPETTVEYAGIAKSTQGLSQSMDGEYMPSHRIQLESGPIGPAFARDKEYTDENDYGVKGISAYPNNRSVNANQQKDYFGAIGGAFGAAIAPLLDSLRPSRKENTIGALRPYHNPSRVGAGGASYMFNPNDRPGPTIRDTTRREGFYTNINANQNGGAYAITDYQPISNSRDTTNISYTGSASAGARSQVYRSYEAEYNQRNNDLKSSTIDGRMVPGNMKLYSGDVKMQNNDRDILLESQYTALADGPKRTSGLITFGHVQKNPKDLNPTIQLERSNPDILEALGGNPYAIPYRAK